MHSFSGIDRRSTGGLGVAFFVEIGVNYNRTVSSAVAQQFLSANGVSPHVIARVTHPDGPRRLTRWELHVDEPGLRKALGARPLLEQYHPSYPDEAA